MLMVIRKIIDIQKMCSEVSEVAVFPLLRQTGKGAIINDQHTIGLIVFRWGRPRPPVRKLVLFLLQKRVSRSTQIGQGCRWFVSPATQLPGAPRLSVPGYAAGMCLYKRDQLCLANNV
jgi:hypothetical protein